VIEVGTSAGADLDDLVARLGEVGWT